MRLNFLFPSVGKAGARSVPADVQRTPARGRRLLILAVLCLALLQPVDVLQAWNASRMVEAAQRLGARAVSGVHALKPVLDAARALDEPARLRAVNDFYNRRVLFREDANVWGQNDYWASPLETLQKGQGDCEDFAIAKYFSLVSAGVSPTKLRLVYVRAMVGGPQGLVQAHMVLAYYAQPQSEPLILDNLLSDIRPASRRPDLSPVFSFNGDGLWQGMGGTSAGDPTARLSRWRDVLAKAQSEGFQ